MRAVWKNGTEYNRDCVGNRVNGVAVKAGVQTNNGLRPGAVHGAEICQGGSTLGARARSAGRQLVSIVAHFQFELRKKSLISKIMSGKWPFQVTQSEARHEINQKPTTDNFCKVQ